MAQVSPTVFDLLVKPVVLTYLVCPFSLVSCNVRSLGSNIDLGPRKSQFLAQNVYTLIEGNYQFVVTPSISLPLVFVQIDVDQC